MIKVLDAGHQITVQDLGRDGFRHLGIPSSGVADRYSLIAGNLLIGNPPSYSGIELGSSYLKVEFYKRTVISVTGAQADIQLNHIKVSMWEAIEINEGDTLLIKVLNSAVFTYLCVSGGIHTIETFNSRSTYVLSTFGNFLGKKIAIGEIIPTGESLPGVFKHIGKSLSSSLIPSYQKKIEVRVVLGLSGYRVSDEGIKNFLNSDWEVLSVSNRVAYRYKGGIIHFNDYKSPFGAGDNSSNVVDIAYPIGTIMVPNIEEVIVMMNDGMTGGGFVTIGAVISSDMDILSQTRANNMTRFVSVTVEQAIEARNDKRKKLDELMNYLK
jgi:biotin-dependent carboxylase-like uncharacterized protein